MIRKLTGIPVPFFILALLVALFSAIPSLFIVKYLVSPRLDRISTQLMVLESKNNTILIPSEASLSGTPTATVSGKAR